MHVRRYSDPGSFLDHAEPFLMREEPENHMMLGIRGMPGSHLATFGDQCYLAVIEDADDVVGCALRTPPFGLIITRADPAALGCLVADVATKYERLPAVMGPEPAVSTFARLWSAHAGTRTRPFMQMRLFVARSVRPLTMPPLGVLRPADGADLPIVTPWMIAFHDEAHTESPLDPSQTVREDVAHQRLFVWDHGGAVSMAAWAGRTARSARIGMAYTPPEYRRRGYASACVAAVTKRLLDEGVSFCCINTDLSNPTTNRIYPAIGYQPLCDIGNIDLNAVDGTAP
jgi:predicted GNAT family acetyltransferase